MKRLLPLLLAYILLGGVLAVFASSGAEPEPSAPVNDACAAATGPNLLTNPSFEGEYSAYIPPEGHPDCQAGICGTAQMAPGWIPWWRSHNPADPPWIIRMPEWKPADPAFIDPVRVRTGEAAQTYFSFYSTHEAGFLQQITTTVGMDYCFRIWGHSWSADDDDDAYSGPFEGQLMQKVGIDPTGGTDWTSPDIIWSESRIQYDYYDVFEIGATATSHQITVYVYSQPLYAAKHNDVYWDDASLQATEVPVTAGRTGGYTVVTTPGSNATTITFTVEYDADPSVTWSAVLDPDGTFDPWVSPTSGTAGDTITAAIDPSAYPPGFYTNTLSITTDPPLTLEPVEVPFHLYVMEQIFVNFTPALRR